MKNLHIVTILLVAIGAINWGLYGLFDLDLVYVIFGSSGLAKLIYIVIGLAGVWLLAQHRKDCKICSAKK